MGKARAAPTHAAHNSIERREHKKYPHIHTAHISTRGTHADGALNAWVRASNTVDAAAWQRAAAARDPTRLADADRSTASRNAAASSRASAASAAAGSDSCDTCRAEAHSERTRSDSAVASSSSSGGGEDEGAAAPAPVEAAVTVTAPGAGMRPTEADWPPNTPVEPNGNEVTTVPAVPAAVPFPAVRGAYRDEAPGAAAARLRAADGEEPCVAGRATDVALLA